MRRRWLTVWRRELRDVLRDRRTLFTMLVLPLVLYPSLMLGFTRLSLSRSEELYERTFPVMVRNGGVVLADPQRRRVDAADVEDSLANAVLDVPQFRFVEVGDPEAAIRSGAIRLYVALPAEGASGGEGAQAGQGEIVPLYRSSDEESAAALRLFERAFAVWQERLAPVRLRVGPGDLATEVERGGRLWGGLLAMMVVLMAMTGAFYPALDVAAGEKERGTLETLLLSPASRRDLVLGKYLTVLTVAVAAALANLGSLTLTMSGFASTIAAAKGGSAGFGMSAPAFAVILAGLLLMAALFSAVCLALSTFARSYKEGQAYLTPALVIVLPLSMVGLLPNLKFTTTVACVPVANLALLMKELLRGSFPLREIALTLGTLALLAVLSLRWATRLFEREDVLFREGRLLGGAPGGPRSGRPTIAAAVLGLLASLAWTWHVSTRIADWGPVIGLPALLLGLAVVGLAATRLSTGTMRRGLGLERISARNVLAGALVGFGGAGFLASIGYVQQRWLGSPEAVSRELAQQLEPIARLGLPAALLMMAVLPGICEEILFRGLLLQGFRAAMGDVVAVLLSAAIFGAYHFSEHRFFPQAFFGIMAGVLVLGCGSLWVPMIAHVVANATLVTAATVFGDAMNGFPAHVAAAVAPCALIGFAIARREGAAR